MTTPERIKQLRKERGWTQAVMADLLGVSLAAEQQYEAGKYAPRPEILARLAALEKDPAIQPEPRSAESDTRHIEMLLAIKRSGDTRANRIVNGTIEVFYDIVCGEASAAKPERKGKAV